MSQEPEKSIFDRYSQKTEKGLGFRQGKAGFRQPVIQRIDLIGDRAPEIGLFKIAFLKIGLLENRMVKYRLAHVAFHEIAITNFAGREGTLFQAILAEYGTVEEAAPEIGQKAELVASGKIEAEKPALVEANGIERRILKFHQNKIASFKDARNKAAFAERHFIKMT